MILYLDTSALVKLYARENHTLDVRRWVRKAEAIATSVVAYAEARAAFARALRSGDSSEREHQRRVVQFNRDWVAFMKIELLPTIARNAGELAELHALRGFDAIHLASGLWLRDKAGEDFLFAAFDHRLCIGVDAVGMALAR